MPTVISHAVAAAALIAAFPAPALPRRLIALGAVCSMAPDFDVCGFAMGIKYGDLLGHRGLSHSLAFAAVLGALGTMLVCFRPTTSMSRALTCLYLFLATASHGLLDAFTDGGLGVAFLAPFDTTRYFFPWTPIAVSPIGAGFFSPRGWEVLVSEFQWVWLPSVLFAGTAWGLRRGLTAPQPAA